VGTALPVILAMAETVLLPLLQEHQLLVLVVAVATWEVTVQHLVMAEQVAEETGFLKVEEPQILEL
jgi:hypothetical protein